MATGSAATLAGLTGYAKGMAWQSRHRDDAIASSPIVGLPFCPSPGSPFARLRIPRISLDLMVLEGTRAEDLLKGPGHLSGTALPGDADNCVLAGHRDIHFRRLGELRKGDPIELTRDGRLVRYVVAEVQIVKASEEDKVLETHGTPRLTLVTCYPFHYIGSAPQRYVVMADLKGVSLETPER